MKRFVEAVDAIHIPTHHPPSPSPLLDILHDSRQRKLAEEGLRLPVTPALLSHLSILLIVQ